MSKLSPPSKPRKLDNTRNHRVFKSEVIQNTFIDFSQRAIICNICHDHAPLSDKTYSPVVKEEVVNFKQIHGNCKIRKSA